MINYLTKKKTTYWYRRKIKDYGEVLLSLKTKDYNKALIRHSYFDYKIKRMIYKGLFEKMTVLEIRELINKYKNYMIEEEYNDFEDQRDKDLSITLDGEFFGGHTKEALGFAVDRYGTIHKSNDIEKVKEETSKILQRSNLKEDYEKLETDKERSIFHWELFKTEWELLKENYEEQKERTGNLKSDEEVINYNLSQQHFNKLETLFQSNPQILEVVKSSNPNNKQDLTVLELTNKYINEKRDAKGWSPRNEKDIKFVLGKLSEHCRDKTVNQLVREDFSSFRDDILKNIPLQITKTEFKDKTIQEIIKIVNKKKYDKIGLTTINKHLKRVHQVFEWGFNTDIVKKNLTKDLYIVDKKKSKKQKTAKIPYTEPELKKIFEDSPWFNENIIITMKYNPEYVFIPLLALFTGAKNTELAQLRVSAIKKKNGILGIDFNQMIKTTYSERFTPLSQTLIDLGFMEYVKFQKRNKQLQLFPAVVVYQDNGTNFTNAYTRYNREFITKEKDKTFSKSNVEK
jgi:integrase